MNLSKLMNDINKHEAIKKYTLESLHNLEEASIKEVILFHSNNKYLFMMYNKSILQNAGNVLARYQKEKHSESISIYTNLIKDIFKSTYTKKQAVNTCEHMFGYFKHHLNKEEKMKYLTLQEQYRKSLISLDILLKEIKTYSISYNQSYLLNQSILNIFLKINL